ncbi:MAG: glutamine-hydrolyzing carbamoyl-phosphate synthase small subunit [Acidobacteria bacterium]|nr:glutamine-hydrolyzing carbamoyl-phosphate synthase small subunit [Acidobacteriota bacterium]
MVSAGRHASNKAYLALEDGLFFEGLSYGADGERGGEVCFNTSMSGYQEILTDPSYCGQIVVMTSAHVGNYGVNVEDAESRKIQVEGFAARELSRIRSNWRSSLDLADYLRGAGVPAIHGIDTRRLTIHLRTYGAKRGILSTLDGDRERLVRRAREVPSMIGLDLTGVVTTRRPYLSGATPNVDQLRPLVVAYDFGIKSSMVAGLVNEGITVEVVESTTPPDRVLARSPAGILFSNGPGDPEPVAHAIDACRVFLEHQIPFFGICLGHQIMGLAIGGHTYKLKFGHRGANHPVKHLPSGRVEITAQNHGFAVDGGSIDPDVAEITHVNLNDDSVEGLRVKNAPAMSVQYHPEASPGPHDARYLFRDFARIVLERWTQGR